MQISSQISILIALLPHLDALDDHLAVLLPGRVPLAPSVPEIFLFRLAAVDPWLTMLAVLEPTVGGTHTNIEDQIERVIERGIPSPSLRPRVDVPSAIPIGERKGATLPEPLVEVGVEHLQQSGVDVREEVVFAPLEAERVEFIRVGGVQSFSLIVCPPPGVVGWIGSPVESGRDDVISALRMGGIVSTTLNEIDLTGRRPWAVCLLDGHHPDCRPQPEALGELGHDLDTAVRDRGSLLGADTSRLDRVDDGSVRGIGGRNAVERNIRGANAHLSEIEDGAVRRDERFVHEGRADMQRTILDVRVLLEVGRVFELTVPVEAPNLSAHERDRRIRRTNGGQLTRTLQPPPPWSRCSRRTLCSNLPSTLGSIYG